MPLSDEAGTDDVIRGILFQLAFMERRVIDLSERVTDLSERVTDGASNHRALQHWLNENILPAYEDQESG